MGCGTAMRGGNFTVQVVAPALSLTWLDCLDGILSLSGPPLFSLIKSEG